MRILFVTIRIPYPPTDGGAIATLELMRGLANAGHDLTLCALNTNKHRQDPVVMAPIARTFCTDINTDIKPGSMAGNLLFGGLPYNVVRFWSAAHAALITKTLTEDGPFDIIQLEGAYAGLYLPAIRKATNAPVLLRAHNVEFEIWRRMALHESNPAKRWYYRHLSNRIRRFEQGLLSQLDGLAAITERDLHALTHMGFAGKGLYLPAGCPIAVSPPQAPPALRRLGFIGSLDWLPNQQGIRWFLREVWPKVHTQHPDLAFVLAGKNAPPDLKHIHQAGVRMMGEVPSAIDFIADIDVVVCPLHSGSGMRLKVVEAMGQGKCVIATAIGAEGIGATPEKHYICAETPDDWVRAVSRLAGQPQVIGQMGAAAHSFAQQHYGWAALTEHLLDFYSTLKHQQA